MFSAVRYHKFAGVPQLVALMIQYFDVLLSLISEGRTHLYQTAHFKEARKRILRKDKSKQIIKFTTDPLNFMYLLKW